MKGGKEKYKVKRGSMTICLTDKNAFRVVRNMNRIVSQTIDYKQREWDECESRPVWSRLE